MKKHPYDLSYQNLLSMNMGEFVPIGVKEVLPNDSVRHSVTALIRTQPMLAPLMHRVNASIVHYFVPTRTIWEDFPDFITGGRTGTVEPTPPYLTVPVGGYDVGSLADYLGCTPSEGDGLQVSALRFRAVASVYNEWIRDQDLIDPVGLSTASGEDTTTNTDLLMAMWEKDKYTTARPWPQKGPEVMLPIVGDAPIKYAQIGASGAADDKYTVLRRDVSGVTQMRYGDAFGDNTGSPEGDTNFNLEAEMSEVAGISIIDQRFANFVQRFQEKMARRGSEFKDYLRQLGVRFSDARLQIPERLGSTTSVLQFSEVLATAESTGVEIGDMKGHGIMGLRTKGYDYWFEEHGYVVSFLVVRPKTVYMHAMDPDWFYQSKYDYWQPGLEHVGQAEILNKEIRLGHTSPEDVFGYQDRYDHLRYSENRVAGEFRTLLNYWHMARDLPTDVALNADFVACNPTDRIWPVDRRLADSLYCNVLHSMFMRRLVSSNTNSFLR